MDSGHHTNKPTAGGAGQNEEQQMELKDNGSITLRDYFAAAALMGITGHFTGPKEKAGESSAQAHARWSYNVADAMLAERSK
jgi:hypothetical protein